MHAIALLICEKLSNNRQWLFLRELIYVMEKSGIEIPQFNSPLESQPNTPPCLMSRIIHPEKWELTLDGLMNLFPNNRQSSVKEEKTSRICYLLNMNNNAIQPILQTMSAKGGWSSGRSIALKRMKEQLVEGMTEQDRRVSATICQSSGYYEAGHYYFNTDKALVELCGHPLLFLYTNPEISLELIKAQPELITEETKNGIRLITNVTNVTDKNILIKETQTRYKLISLSAEQQKVIGMLSKGITIPLKALKAKANGLNSKENLMSMKQPFSV